MGVAPLQLYENKTGFNI